MTNTDPNKKYVAISMGIAFVTLVLSWCALQLLG